MAGGVKRSGTTSSAASLRAKAAPAVLGATFTAVTTGVVSAYSVTGSVAVTCIAGGLGVLVVLLQILAIKLSA